MSIGFGKMKLYFRKRVVIGFVLALGIITLLAIYSFLSIQRLIQTAQLLSHGSRVINNSEQLLVITTDLETGQRGYIITGDKSYLDPYRDAVQKLEKHLAQLDSITRDYPEQNNRIDTLTDLIRRRAERAERTIAARAQSFEAAQALVLTGEGKILMGKIRGLIHRIQEEERRIFREQNTVSAATLRQFQISFIALLIVPAVIIALLFYSIIRHFTARSKAESQLIGASSEISHLNKELEAYTYSVSHDLRAPLRSISGYSQILKEDYSDKLDAEGQRVISVIINNAKRMGQLIDDLLEFSRTGRKEMNKTRIQPDEMVKEVIRDLTQNQNGHPIHIRIEPLATALADASMLRQVWINLISNAIKYSAKKDQTKIEIGSFNDIEGTGFYVKDNGVGFNIEYKDKLFGVFQRLHKSDEFEGTGVGLALVKRIITRHGGKVWADAKLGEGAIFYFSLPK
jgi:signal transduction histidine kinase